MWLRIARRKKNKTAWPKQRSNPPELGDGVDDVLDHLNRRHDIEAPLRAVEVPRFEDWDATVNEPLQAPALLGPQGSGEAMLAQVKDKTAGAASVVQPGCLWPHGGQAADPLEHTPPLIRPDRRVRVLDLVGVVHQRVRTLAGVILLRVDAIEVHPRIGHKGEAAICAARYMEQQPTRFARFRANWHDGRVADRTSLAAWLLNEWRNWRILVGSAVCARANNNGALNDGVGNGRRRVQTPLMQAAFSYRRSATSPGWPQGGR